MADKKLNVDLTATDKASAKIEHVADKADALEKMSPEVEVTADTSQAEGGLDRIKGQLGEIDGPIGDIGSKLGALASPGGAIGALGAGLLLAGDHAADVAIEADNLARLTGDSVEQASRLNAVFKQSGVDAKDLQDVLLQAQGVLADDAELAAQLGVNLNDGRGIGERFVEVVGKVQDQFDDAGERAVVMSRLFGEEGVRQVNSVIARVGDLSSAVDAVPDAAVVNDEDVSQAREYKAQLSEFKVEMAAFATTIGQEVLPLLTSMATISSGISETLSNLRGGLGKNFWGEEDEDRFATAGQGVDQLTSSINAAAAATANAADIAQRLSEVQEQAAGVQASLAIANGHASDAERDYVDQLLRHAGLTPELIANEQQLTAAREAAAEAGAAAAENFRDRFNESMQSAGDSIWSFTEEANGSWTKLRDQLATNIVEAQTWQGHLVAIAQETSPAFAQELAKLGPAALGAVAEMRATEGGVQEAFGLWTEAAKITTRDVSAELSGGLPGAATAGSKAFRAAMGNETRVAADNAYKQGLQIGQSLSSGIADGVTASAAQAREATRAAMHSITRAAKEALQIDD